MKNETSTATTIEDEAKWRDFSRHFVLFCVNMFLKIPKKEEPFLCFTRTMKFTLHDFPANTCLRVAAYERLNNLTCSEMEGVTPVELVNCIEKMLQCRTARDFEVWIDKNYNEYHTPNKVF